MRDGEIAAKKAALSKALSAAYLESQVADLESKVKNTHVNGDQGRSSSELFRDRRDDAHQQQQQQPPTPTRVNDQQRQQQQQLWRASPIPTLRARIDNSPSPPPTPINNGEWNIYVVDVSALMWAPHCIRKMLNSTTSVTELIIPQDAIQTLDLLKKGNSSIAVAARSATRFVEHATRLWKPVSVDPSIAVQVGTNYKKGRGLRIQRENETVSLEDDLIQDTWLNNVIGCASYFLRIQRAEDSDSEWDEPRPLVLIAHPPLSAESGPSDMEHSERAEGHTLSLEAGRFELALKVLRDDETEDVARRGGRSRGSGGRGRNNGRGGGGGGGGGGRRRKEPGPEPEREVKILLRRPEKAEDSAPSSPNANVDHHPDMNEPPFSQVRPTPQPQSHLPRPTQISTKAPPPHPQSQQQAKQKQKSTDDRSDAGRNRGRGKGRGGRGRGHFGGGFVLLQRPDTLVHHVGRGEFDRSGGNLAEGSGNNGGGNNNINGPANANASGNAAGNANWRRAYASNDEPPPPARNKVTVLQRPR